MAAAAARQRWQLAVLVAAGSGGVDSDGWGIDKNQQSTKIRRRRSGGGSVAAGCGVGSAVVLAARRRLRR
jgi:hypothetical protein